MEVEHGDAEANLEILLTQSSREEGRIIEPPNVSKRNPEYLKRKRLRQKTKKKVVKQAKRGESFIAEAEEATPEVFELAVKSEEAESDVHVGV